jgi:hypothetical protein
VRGVLSRLSVGYRTIGSNLLIAAELVPIAAISQILPKIFPRHDPPITCCLFAKPSTYRSDDLSWTSTGPALQNNADILSDRELVKNRSAFNVKTAGLYSGKARDAAKASREAKMSLSERN